jgi:hypothetical protein
MYHQVYTPFHITTYIKLVRCTHKKIKVINLGCLVTCPLYSGIKVSYTLPTLGGIVGVASRQACPRFFVITESTIRMH